MRRLRRHVLVLALWCAPLCAAVAFRASSSEATCEAVGSLHIPHVTLTVAQAVKAGGLELSPDELPRPDSSFFTAFDTLPAFCRVQGVSSPSAASRIGFEVWLPAGGWNGRYVGAGNGGDGGSINYYRLAEAVNGGYVGSSTDTGHRGRMDDRTDTGIDFDERAIHETADITKVIVAAFYGRGPAHSYFHSCSNGGRQALTEAQRYPGDYDGISAGAPAFDNLASPAHGVSRPSLRTFKDRGGKLVIYHGDRDEPAPSITYYRRLVAALGQRATNDFARLYVIPGMGHCGGGPVPEFGTRLWPAAADARHSIVLALERWVERGVAPDAIIATKYRVDDDPSSPIERTRPLCPFPLRATWTSAGSPDEAANYVCAPPGLQ